MRGAKIPTARVLRRGLDAALGSLFGMLTDVACAAVERNAEHVAKQIDDERDVVRPPSRMATATQWFGGPWVMAEIMARYQISGITVARRKIDYSLAIYCTCAVCGQTFTATISEVAIETAENMFAVVDDAINAAACRCP